ncbi:MAG: SDR family oxidoreductase [Spirochaetaceae bacterium]|nr:MAG: SDR family oxidoreductase [Spirochaetaceae bacterium]
MNTGLSGRVVLVTGGAGGLGAAAASAFHDEGARVVLVDRDRERVTQVARDIGANCRPCELDLCVEADVEQTLGALQDELGHVAVLVHCAGIARGPDQMGPNGWLSMQDVSISDWQTVLTTNLTATFLINRTVARSMIAAGWGRIINVASMSALVANRGLSGLGPYAASKGGVISLSRVLAAEWAQHGITVNCISPGYMATSMGTRSQSIPGFRELQIDMNPQRRLGEPNEFANAAVYLASDGAAHVNGHNLVIDGGYTVW